MNYKFYANVDSTKESIDRKEASSLESAISKFAKIKRLPVPKFLKLFTVEEDEGNKGKT